MSEHTREWPASAYQHLVGRTVRRVDQSDADEGLSITFDDGSTLDVGFSSFYGRVDFRGPPGAGGEAVAS